LNLRLTGAGSTSPAPLIPSIATMCLPRLSFFSRKGEAQARRDLMELHGDEVEIDV